MERKPKNHAMSKFSVIKFIDLYRSNECLWKASNENYRNSYFREIAYESISKNMNISNFGPRQVHNKIKRLRSLYLQELKKQKGYKGRSVYKSAYEWFNAIDSFLRPTLKTNSGRNQSAKKVFKSNYTGKATAHHSSQRAIDDPLLTVESTNPRAIKLTAEKPVKTQHVMAKEQLNSKALDMQRIDEPGPSRTMKKRVDEGIENEKVMKVFRNKNHRLKEIIKIIESKRKLSPPIDLTERVMKSSSSCCRSQEYMDEFESFGKYVAVSLKTMTFECAITAESELHKILTTYKIYSKKMSNNPESISNLYPINSIDPSTSLSMATIMSSTMTTTASMLTNMTISPIMTTAMTGARMSTLAMTTIATMPTRTMISPIMSIAVTRATTSTLAMTAMTTATISSTFASNSRPLLHSPSYTPYNSPAFKLPMRIPNYPVYPSDTPSSRQSRQPSDLNHSSSNSSKSSDTTLDNITWDQ